MKFTKQPKSELREQSFYKNSDLYSGDKKGDKKGDKNDKGN